MSDATDIRDGYAEKINALDIEIAQASSAQKEHLKEVLNATLKVFNTGALLSINVNLERIADALEKEQ